MSARAIRAAPACLYPVKESSRSNYGFTAEAFQPEQVLIATNDAIGPCRSRTFQDAVIVVVFFDDASRLNICNLSKASDADQPIFSRCSTSIISSRMAGETAIDDFRVSKIENAPSFTAELETRDDDVCVYGDPDQRPRSALRAAISLSTSSGFKLLSLA